MNDLYFVVLSPIIFKMLCYNNVYIVKRRKREIAMSKKRKGEVKNVKSVFRPTEYERRKREMALTGHHTIVLKVT